MHTSCTFDVHVYRCNVHWDDTKHFHKSTCMHVSGRHIYVAHILHTGCTNVWLAFDLWLSLYKVSGHQCKAGSDSIGEIQEAFLRGVGLGAGLSILLGERQDAGSRGGDIGVGPLAGADAPLVGEAGLQPALDLCVGEAEVAGRLPHLTHHKHLLMLMAAAAWAAYPSWFGDWAAAWVVSSKLMSSKSMANQSWGREESTFFLSTSQSPSGHQSSIIKVWKIVEYDRILRIMWNIVNNVKYCGYVSAGVCKLPPPMIKAMSWQRHIRHPPNQHPTRANICPHTPPTRESKGSPPHQGKYMSTNYQGYIKFHHPTRANIRESKGLTGQI